MYKRQKQNIAEPSDEWKDIVYHKYITFTDLNRQSQGEKQCKVRNNKLEKYYKETFMGFHCGNTAASKLTACSMKYQMIMARTLPEEVTQGTQMCIRDRPFLPEELPFAEEKGEITHEEHFRSQTCKLCLYG